MTPTRTAATTGDPSVPAGLTVAVEQVRDELKRADAKATTLLSLVGAALAGVIALTGRTLPPAAVAVLWAAVVPIGGAVVLLLTAILPRLGGHAAPAAGSWLHAASVGPQELLAAYAPEATPIALAVHVCGLARIAVAKYQRIRAAVVLLLAGLGLLACSLPLQVMSA